MSGLAGGVPCFGLGGCVVDVLGCCRQKLGSEREGSVFVKKDYWPLKRVR